MKAYSSDEFLYYIQQIREQETLTPVEERKMLKRIKAGDEKAREEFIKSNLKLVVKIALEFITPGIEIMDIIQEGNLGLLKAIERFKLKRKVKFSTYASWWIKHYIIRYILKNKYAINVPIRKAELLWKIEKAEEELRKKNGRDPTIEEIADYVGVPAEKIEYTLYFIPQVTYMDSDFIASIGERGGDPAEVVEQKIMCELARRMLNRLNNREKKMLEYRFGIKQEYALTLKKVGKIFNLSVEGVRQIQIKALKRLRESMSHFQFSP